MTKNRSEYRLSLYMYCVMYALHTEVLKKCNSTEMQCNENCPGPLHAHIRTLQSCDSTFASLHFIPVNFLIVPVQLNQFFQHVYTCIGRLRLSRSFQRFLAGSFCEAIFSCNVHASLGANNYNVCSLPRDMHGHRSEIHNFTHRSCNSEHV